MSNKISNYIPGDYRCHCGLDVKIGGVGVFWAVFITPIFLVNWLRGGGLKGVNGVIFVEIWG